MDPAVEEGVEGRMARKDWVGAGHFFSTLSIG